MKSILNPYINFVDNAREAITFYQSVLGGDLNISTFGQAGMEGANPEGIMHAQLTCENGMNIMVSDIPPGMKADHMGGNVSLSLSGDNEAELKGYWDKLSDGASITVPLDKAPWGDQFGMLTDKFGVAWLVNIAPAK